MASTTAPDMADTIVAVDLTLHASSPNRDQSTDKENRAPFFQNLADRIKERSRRAAPSNHIASVTTTMQPKQLPSPTPQKFRLPKRPAIAEQASSKKPTRRQKVLKYEDTGVREDTRPAALPTRPTSDIRPLNDPAGNRDFADQVLKVLKQELKPEPLCFGDRQNERMHYLLTESRPANDEEMLFLSGAEAAAKLQPGVFHSGPILTEGQQPLPLQTVQGFLNEHYDDDIKIWIQDPGVTYASHKRSVRQIPIRQVKDRILEGKGKVKSKVKCKVWPWNCLELATHVEDGLRPTFLSGEDTRLLTKLKLEHATEYAGRRSYPQGYKEVEKWALLAEAGANTEPHQDSHGYSTYITANQGRIGFGWLSNPLAEERKSWTENPASIPGDRYRYVVLNPGQTVYFHRQATSH